VDMTSLSLSLFSLIAKVFLIHLISTETWEEIRITYKTI